MASRRFRTKGDVATRAEPRLAKLSATLEMQKGVRARRPPNGTRILWRLAQFPLRMSFSEFKSNQASPWVARNSHTNSVPCDSALTGKSNATFVQGASPDSLLGRGRREIRRPAP